jgi:microcystin-dependent protein
MAQPYVGEIRMFAGNFAPAGWMFCSGQLLPISEYETLFNLIGTTYGGDGQSTFQLPDLRGRLPIHQGNGFTLAQPGGAETVTLNVQQIAAHSHPVVASTTPGNNVLSPKAAIPGVPFSTQAGIATYTTNAPATALQPTTVGFTGGNQPHENIQPFLCISFILSLFGIFPSPT